MTICLAYAPTEPGRAALRHCVAEARATGCDVLVVNAARDWHDTPAELDDDAVREVEEQLDGAGVTWRWHEGPHGLSGADESLTAAEHRLKVAMMGSEALDSYDYVMLDMPPSLGRLTLNGLVAADSAVAVTVPEALAINGVNEYLTTIEEARHPVLNPHLTLAGVVTNMVDSRLGEHRYQLDQMREAWGDDLLAPVIPARSAVKDMASTRTPLTKTGNRGAKAVSELFDQLTAHIVKEK